MEFEQAKKRGGKRPGAGRRRLPQGAGRDRRLALRLTAAEYEELLRQAGTVPLSRWIRARLGL